MQIRQLVVDIGTNGAVAEFSGGKLTVTGIEPGQLFAALGEIERIITPKKEEPKRGLSTESLGVELEFDPAGVPGGKINFGVDVASRPNETFTISAEAAQPEAKPALDGNGAKAFLKEEAAKIPPAAPEPARREAKPAEEPARTRRASVERDRDSVPVIPRKPAEAKPVEPAVIPAKEHLRAAPQPAFVKPATVERGAAETARVATESEDARALRDARIDERVVVGVVRDQPADDSDNEPEREETKEELDVRLAASAQRDAEYNARIAAKKAEQSQTHVRAAVKAEDPAALVDALRKAPRPAAPAPKPEPRVIEPVPAQEAPAEPEGDSEEPAFNVGAEEREYSTLGPVIRAIHAAHKGTPLSEDTDKLAELSLPFCRKWVKPVRELAGSDDAVKKEFTRRFKQLYAISG